MNTNKRTDTRLLVTREGSRAGLMPGWAHSQAECRDTGLLWSLLLWIFEFFLIKKSFKTFSQNYNPIKKYTKFFLKACRLNLNLPTSTGAPPHRPAKPQSNQASSGPPASWPPRAPPATLRASPACQSWDLQAPSPRFPPAARGSRETHMAAVRLSRLPPTFCMKTSVLRAASAPALSPATTPPQARLPITFPLECTLLPPSPGISGDWVMLLCVPDSVSWGWGYAGAPQFAPSTVPWAPGKTPSTQLALSMYPEGEHFWLQLQAGAGYWTLTCSATLLHYEALLRSSSCPGSKHPLNSSTKKWMYLTAIR